MHLRAIVKRLLRSVGLSRQPADSHVNTVSYQADSTPESHRFVTVTEPQTASPSDETSVSPPPVSTHPNWLPNWRKLVEEYGDRWEHREGPAKGKKILVATVAGGHDACTPIESLLAAALKMRGAEVHVLLCDGVLPACLQITRDEFASIEEFLDGALQRKFCEGCVQSGTLAFDIPGVTLHKFSDYLTVEDKTVASTLAGSIPADELTSYVYEGIEVGVQVKAACLRFLVRGSFDGEPAAEAVVRRYLEAAILSVMVAQRLYSAIEVECLVINHGIYVPHGTLADAASKQNRRLVSWSFSYRTQCAVFSHDKSEVFTGIDEPNSLWENMEWHDWMEREIVDYLESRAGSGSKDWIMPFQRDSQRDLSVLSQTLQIDFSKPTVGLCTNVIWDGAVCYAANSFCSMVDWLLNTITYFGTRPDLQLVVRVHPAEVKFTNKSRERALDVISAAFPVLPPNVFVIPPESNANTYIVMEQCQAVIVYGSTMAMELAARGIPIIVTGQAWIRNKGFAYEANSEAEYRVILDKLPFPEFRMNRELTRRALMYAYHYNMRRCIPIEHSFAREGWPFMGVSVDALEDLVGDKCPALDTICNGILHRSEFIYPAERLVPTQFCAPPESVLTISSS